MKNNNKLAGHTRGSSDLQKGIITFYEAKDNQNAPKSIEEALYVALDEVALDSDSWLAGKNKFDECTDKGLSVIKSLTAALAVVITRDNIRLAQEAAKNEQSKGIRSIIQSGFGKIKNIAKERS